MRKLKDIENEIVKLRKVYQSDSFPENAKNNAWAMMLALEWAATSKKYLTPMELSGITMVQSAALKKQVKRESKLPR